MNQSERPLHSIWTILIGCFQPNWNRTRQPESFMYLRHLVGVSNPTKMSNHQPQEFHRNLLMIWLVISNQNWPIIQLHTTMKIWLVISNQTKWPHRQLNCLTNLTFPKSSHRPICKLGLIPKHRKTLQGRDQRCWLYDASPGFLQSKHLGQRGEVTPCPRNSLMPGFRITKCIRYDQVKSCIIDGKA
jgi:hypothetical protein